MFPRTIFPELSRRLTGARENEEVVLGFLAYALILFLLVTLCRLPSENLLQRGVLHLTEGKVSISAERISPTFPFGFQLENVEVGVLLGRDFSRDNVKLLQVLLDHRRFLMGYFPLVLKGTLVRGNFEMKAGVSILRGAKDSYVMLKASEIYLEDFDFIRLFSHRKLLGKTEVEVNLRGNFQGFTRINGEGHLFLEGGSVEARLDSLGLKDFPFRTMAIPFAIKEGLISLKEAEMAGPVFSASLSGEIRLKLPLEMSSIQLNARLRPGAELGGNGHSDSFPLGMGGRNEPLVIRFGGTLQNPSVSWSQS